MVTWTGVVQRPLRLVLPPWQPPRADGVVAVVVEEHLTRGWAQSLLARRDDRLYVWSAAEAGIEVRARDILGYPGVVAASMAPAGADPRRLGLAVEVACRLAAERRSHAAGAAEACLTSWLPPQPLVGTVRVPHLVTVWHGGLATDSVVWEVLDLEAARRWLGSADAGFVEANLDALVRLHAAVRTGRLPPTTAAARLRILLGPGRDLQTSLVFQRPELFRALLAGNADSDHC
jgi:hypothetical protein